MNNQNQYPNTEAEIRQIFAKVAGPHLDQSSIDAATSVLVPMLIDRVKGHESNRKGMTCFFTGTAELFTHLTASQMKLDNLENKLKMPAMSTAQLQDYYHGSYIQGQIRQDRLMEACGLGKSWTDKVTDKIYRRN